MSPRLRRALHEALDHVLDALAADEADAAAEGANPRAKKRGPRPIAPGKPSPDPEVRAKALAALTKAGLR